MALSHYVTYASGVTGTQPSVNLDPSISPFNCTVAVVIVGGSASYGIQFSHDANDVSDANSRWFADPTFGTGIVASGYVVYNNPITKVRIVIASNTGGLELKTLQGFTQN